MAALLVIVGVFGVFFYMAKQSDKKQQEDAQARLRASQDGRKPVDDRSSVVAATGDDGMNAARGPAPLAEEDEDEEFVEHQILLIERIEEAVDGLTEALQDIKADLAEVKQSVWMQEAEKEAPHKVQEVPEERAAAWGATASAQNTAVKTAAAAMPPDTARHAAPFETHFQETNEWEPSEDRPAATSVEEQTAGRLSQPTISQAEPLSQDVPSATANEIDSVKDPADAPVYTYTEADIASWEADFERGAAGAAHTKKSVSSDGMVQEHWETEPGSSWKAEELVREEETASRHEAPKPPTFLDKVWEGICSLGISRFIAASNIWVLAGICIMLIGLVFLVRYAVELRYITEEMRLAFAAAVGLGMLVIGWRHREKYRELGLILQGGGVGALYLTVVAAVHLYDLIPRNFAFVLLVCIVAFSTFLAVVQYARIMAHVAYMAGFLAPILVSSGTNNYIALFGFYILLNLGIIGVSRYRNWRGLHLTGFIFTAVIGGAWGSKGYAPEFLFNVELFLNAFFIIFSYLALAGSPAARFTLKDRNSLLTDVPLTFGTPLLYLIFQGTLVRDIPFALAFICVVLGFGYLAVTMRLKSLWRAAKAEYAKLEVAAPDSPEQSGTPEAGQEGEALPNTDSGNAALQDLSAYIFGINLKMQIYFIFGVLFANLALPLALYDISLDQWRERMMALTWAMEGAMLFWLGRRQDLKVCRVLGALGMLVSIAPLFGYLAAGMPDYSYSNADGTVAMAYGSLGLSLYLHAMYAASFLAAAFAAYKYTVQGRPETLSWQVDEMFFWLGLAAFTGLCAFELGNVSHFFATLLVVFALGSFLARWIGKKLSYPQMERFSLCPYVPLLCIAVPVVVYITGLNLAYFFWEETSYGNLLRTSTCLLATGFALIEMATLRVAQKKGTVWCGEMRGCLLAALLVPLLVNASLDLVRQYTDLYGIWTRLVLFAWPVAGVFLFTRFLVPAKLGDRLWVYWSASPVFFLLMWFVCSFFRLGDPAPLPFIPILNPLELALAISLFALVLWNKHFMRIMPKTLLARLLGHNEGFFAVLFVLLNISVMRSCAMYADMTFSPSGALAHPTCQALFSILWGITGFSAMFFGSRQCSRRLWLLGGALILVDVAKLVLFDLMRTGAGWRIVACLFVGVLLIVIGYYFPLPPSKEKLAAQQGGGETSGKEDTL